MSIKFITGKAGTGKSTLAQTLPNSVLCSTTGISAVNMGTVTINALLKYYDTADMQEKLYNGKLVRAYNHNIAGADNLVIDEVSMMDAAQLDILANLLNNSGTNLTLLGDFQQLPPVDAPWAFTAKCWGVNGFEVQRLEKVWRQDNPTFLEGLNLLRAGRGGTAQEVFKSAGVEFSVAADPDFPGVTIMGMNKEVDEWNQKKYSALNTQEFTLHNHRWGEQPKEWRLIPDQLNLKVGAQVMLLANAYEDQVIAYANGDIGVIVENDYLGPVVKLARGGREVGISQVVREYKEKNEQGVKVVKGRIVYWPIRLCYASTVHKCQGLTVNNAQVDLRGWMMGKPAMTYVACSRVKTPGGLRIVGFDGALASRCSISKEAMEWI